MNTPLLNFNPSYSYLGNHFKYKVDRGSILGKVINNTNLLPFCSYIDIKRLFSWRLV